MFVKVIFYSLFFFTLGYSSYEKVKVGKIDKYYQDKITKIELIDIIKDIENTFESQLGFNVFDYKDDGKPIDLIYMAPSQKRFNLNKSIKLSQAKKTRINKLQKSILEKQDDLSKTQIELQKEYDLLNKDIDLFNNYVQQIQNQKITSKAQYDQIKSDMNEKKRILNRKEDVFNQHKIKYNSSVYSYNQLTSQYNTLVKQFNRLQRQIEVLARSIQEVKGVAKGYTQTIFETYSKGGKTYTQKKEKNYMEKIEIYDFENLAQLKTILAHELAHLVGVEHINIQGALMNPVLQANQIKTLRLTHDDIRGFRNAFSE